MPYTAKHDRESLDDAIDVLIKDFHQRIPFGRSSGNANYTITRILLNVLKPDKGWDYESLSNVVKTLECAKLEISRRLVDVYEKKCIRKNGDIQELAELDM